jgi:Zn-dependent protease/predicted transcriptional regulator
MNRLRFPFLGYTVIIHWSWLIAVSLLTWSLSTGYYPSVWPDYPRALYWLSGLLTTGLLFFSVLLHECAHAGVATAHKVQIHDIMLHIVGGWTMLPRELATPALEAKVAIAGPFCSAIIGVLLWPWSDFPMAHYLMQFNFVLAGYNLMPAFPMDGGRILRAWFWKQCGSFSQATERAARLGKQIAVAMILVGIGGLFLGWSTFWLMIGGVILRMVSDGTHHTVEFSHLLKGRVIDVMIPSARILCLEEGQSIAEVKALFLRYGFHHFPVVRGGSVVGLVHYDDLRKHPDWSEGGSSPIAELVRPITEEIIVSPTTPIQQAFDQMLLTASPRLLVYDGRTFVGMVTRASVTRLRELHQRDSQWVGLTGAAPAAVRHS